MSHAFNVNIDSKGIARLVFDLPNSKSNVFSIPPLDELEKVLDQLKADKSVKALVITSAKEGIFIAGADLEQFKPFIKEPSTLSKLIKKGHEVFDKLEALPFPTIAVINGACMGGGLEMALACKYRVVTDNPKTQLSLPEVNVGIFPGWGGTQRLPRLVGLQEGLTMVVSGKPVDGMKAWKIKLADAIVPTEFQQEKVEQFVQECLTPEGKSKILDRRKRKGLLPILLEKNFLGRALIYHLTKKAILKQTKGQYPAPLAALDLIKNSYTSSLEDGKQKEIQTIIHSTDTALKYAPKLIQIFFNQQELKKNPGVPAGAVPQDVQFAAVIGAGTMGSGISWLFSNNNIPVRMKDINWDVVGKGYGSAWDTYKTLIKIKKIKPNPATYKFQKIAGTVDYTGFQNVDLVIEAATENLDLKLKILKELENEVSDKCIIGTNTSSLTLASMAPSLKHPERFVGMHFFNPVSRMPLVEVVQGEKTSPNAVATAVDICTKLKKTPIVVKDCPGFLVNRILISGLLEIMRLLEEGVAMSHLEKIGLNFGLPMGPFTLADEVGNDVNYKIANIFETAYGERMKVPQCLKTVYENQLFGKKSGKGFYLYENGKKLPNPTIQKLIPEKNTNITDQEVIDRMILLMINEAARCLEEKIVAKPQLVDMAMVLGTGFPPFRGGLLCYADELGIDYVVNTLKNFQQKYGSRFAPAKLLVEMEKDKKTFYG
jgi:3-hydroxyacyl-CoA dehydrogenase/enoyl-CoA hydratase/3-hydroxybutyryl-CoA epimerase